MFYRLHIIPNMHFFVNKTITALFKRVAIGGGGQWEQFFQMFVKPSIWLNFQLSFKNLSHKLALKFNVSENRLQLILDSC